MKQNYSGNPGELTQRANMGNPSDIDFIMAKLTKKQHLQ